MAEEAKNLINAEHPPVAVQTTATVGTPHVVQQVQDKSVTGNDVAWLLGLVAVILTIVGTIYKIVDNMKSRNSAESQARTATIMAAITDSKNHQLDHMKTLEDKLTDRDRQLEKDFMELKADKEHYRNNIKQRDIAFDARIEKIYTEQQNLKGELGTLKERVNGHDGLIKEIKELIREKMDETKDAIRYQGTQFNEALKSQADKEEGHFKELCSSLREISKRDPK